MYSNITGLLIGYVVVAVGQLTLFCYHAFQLNWITQKLSQSSSISSEISSQLTSLFIQHDIKNNYKILEQNSIRLRWKELLFEKPEGFMLLIFYLAIVWIFEQLPYTYYSFNGNIKWSGILIQLLIADFFIYFQHYCEHKWYFISRYVSKHYLHHRVTNPSVFDAFAGHIMDTLYMILIPLHLTTYLCPLYFVPNVWTYMGFGTIFAVHLVLIHSSYKHIWDNIFDKIGIVTPQFHHVHHLHPKHNFGHIFKYWDIVFGTAKYMDMDKNNHITNDKKRVRIDREM